MCKFFIFEVFLIVSFTFCLLKVSSSYFVMTVLVSLELMVSLVLMILSLKGFLVLNLMVFFIVLTVSESVVGLSILMSNLQLQSELDKSFYMILNA
uniref:NADH dehydrogenase subunit 4L n=1 Tax=Falcolipeurus quadripustulatus TaxID=2358485 RepID=A0A386B2C6_9NEOP|nr:NADH dehydrogenase subunit 4L [Falcolipeurus quadripustulatus]